MTRALALVALVLTTVVGCGSTTPAAAPPPQASSSGTSTAFPVTMPHKYGSTTIDAEPKRVVTVGLLEQDSLLALGVVPVGTTEWFGEYPGAIGPWAESRLGGAARPQVLRDTGSGPQFEKIAALDPDLILALYSGLTKEQYETLSKIAPTVAQPKEYIDYGIPWQEVTKRVGLAVGKPAEAEGLVKQVEDRFAEERGKHPEFAGQSGLMATLYEGYFVFGSQDPRNRLLGSLGFQLPPDLDQAIGDKFGANISRERLDLLDTGVIVWSVTDVAKGEQTLHGDTVYKALDVVGEGREVYLPEGTPPSDAVAFLTVLSVPYVLDTLVPRLAAAVDGDPATKTS
ncbi:iron complex transport system substrate-binding protein [Nonomuraea thailandensis]|uniref:Iron complex transport system substrate-binding protein n=1 Tax=Nonomuraea thailandensis TaxID=1188745 RepID=A0A9X2GKU8_9ACTN|nr:iron-siderophore ABC transporter substrate-binding protein [Nonomuraea thailandensis]MCP2356068.1 iron complex transport system substrate-binding protein [Nonomuraea thailandensis]